jgi:hypothetical protein
MIPAPTVHVERSLSAIVPTEKDNYFTSKDRISLGEDEDRINAG